ncbi:MAG: DUF86 domain-containing protein [Actinomycetota bacterium]|nr:DUF86 domain-containing protein [Actinomycetota bacterium]
MNGPVLVDQLVEVLEQIGDLLPDDKDVWEVDVRARLAVERLWITAGNVAEAHRITAGHQVGAEPWAELYGFRNLLAHALPDDLSPDRIWAETISDLPRLLRVVRAVRG